MIKHQKFFAGLLLALGLFLATPLAHAETAPAGKVVKDFYDQLTNVMKQGEALGFGGRYKTLEPTIRSAFNLPLMTRYAVGPTWQKAHESERQQLVSAFSDFSIATYASRFAKYDGETFEVLGEKPSSGGGIIVETKLTPKGEEPVSLNYLMRLDDAGVFRIVDVFFYATISELATRRAEFSSIVTNEGLDALVSTLSEKSKKMGPS